MDKYIKFVSKFLIAILITVGFIFAFLALFIIGYAIYKAYNVLFLGRPF